MQIFICPFCGLRPEMEFRFSAEAGKTRPEPAPSVSDAEWAAYLFSAAAPMGKAQEVWLHMTCGELFLMTRDTVTRRVIAANPLPGRQL